MRSKLSALKRSRDSFCDGTFRFLSSRRLIAGIALALAVVAVPSRSSAQISLGTGQYGVFEESGGTFALSGASAITGNVELGLNAKLNKDQSSSISGSTTPNVSAVSTTLPGPNSVTPYANGFSVTSANTVTLTGSAGVNVYNIMGSMSLSGGGTLKIIGAANETFVFNVSNGVSFTGASKMVLSGVDANQIIFNVTGNTSIDGASKALGTFVDQNGTITVNGASTVTGALVSSGTITVEGASRVTADAFVAPVSVQAPETPPISAAGIACILTLGCAGIRRIRR